jgi:hypothetical protein
MTKEELYRSKIDMYFEKYFYIEREVWSTNKRRIDYVLKCKVSGALFGVEVKHLEHMRGVDIGEYIMQAHDYAKHFWKTKFNETPTKLLIFITPAISNFLKQVIPESLIELTPTWYDGKPDNTIKSEYYQSFHKSTHDHSNVNSMLGVFGIGEIRKIENRFKFIYSNKIIWQSHNNPNFRLHQESYLFYNNKL